MVRLAVEHPAILNKLVLVGGSPDSAEPEHRPLVWRTEFERAVAADDLELGIRIYASLIFSEAGTEDLAENWLKGCLQVSPEVLRAFFFDSAPDPDEDVTALLPHVGIPTLVMHGMDDQVMRVEAGQSLKRAIPGAQFYGFAKKGHLPLFTATQEFCDVLSSFVRYGTVPAARPTA